MRDEGLGAKTPLLGGSDSDGAVTATRNRLKQSAGPIDIWSSETAPYVPLWSYMNWPRGRPRPSDKRIRSAGWPVRPSVRLDGITNLPWWTVQNSTQPWHFGASFWSVRCSAGSGNRIALG